MRNALKILLVSTISLIAGCNNSDIKEPKESMEKELDALDSQEVYIDSIEVTQEKNDSIPLISGSCENGREIGDLDQYQIKMKIGSSPTDSISVRSDAACFEIKTCDHNILGKINSGTIIYAQGPLKNRGFSAGIAYAFPVKDQNGKMCRAYLSYLNVEEVK